MKQAPLGADTDWEGPLEGLPDLLALLALLGPAVGQLWCSRLAGAEDQIGTWTREACKLDPSPTRESVLSKSRSE